MVSAVGISRFAQAMLFSLAVLFSLSAMAAPREGLAPEVLREVFPEAMSLGPFEGNPQAAEARINGRLAGYVFSTRDDVGSVGLSGKPFDILVGMNLQGRIVGAKLLEHHEPILVLGIGDARLQEFVGGHRGLDIRSRPSLAPDTPPERRGPDIISGATVSSKLFFQGILDSAKAVARSRGLLRSGAPGQAIDVDSFQKLDWAALLVDGSVGRLRLDGGEVIDRFAEQDATPRAQAVAGATFIDLHVALATPAGIGRVVLGDKDYNQLLGDKGENGQTILIAANGLYSFKGTSFSRSGAFERVQIVQGARTFRLLASGYKMLEHLAEGMPEFREIGLFRLAPDSGFDPAMPWRIQVVVAGERLDGVPSFATFSLIYHTPQRLLRAVPQAAPPDEGLPWKEEWQAKSWRVGIAIAALVVLAGMITFQDQLTRRPRLWRRMRDGYLVFTVLWLGVYCGAQLSVINVISFVQMSLNQFRWDYFLLLPLVFLLWCFAAVGLLFWGRGVFCGWLCPFGALQELVHRLGGWLRVPRIKVPFLVHERLWVIKYLLFLAIAGLAPNYTDTAIAVAEIEPFKTVVTLHFARDLPYVLFALGLLGGSMFIERVFCRYLCVLGAGLAIPARIKMFEWLKRRPKCGSECGICAARCPVQAIHPDGHINPNECIYCMQCQMAFYDEDTCPPLIQRKKRRVDRLASAEMAEKEP